MFASEARKLTEQAKTQQSPSNEFWHQAKCWVYNGIEMSAQKGHSQTKINLKTVGIEIFNKNLDRIKYELEQEGYKVEFLLTRTPNGAREMIVSW